ncbi:hypothetical protein [Mesorhizobium erdmanii]|nr:MULTISPECIES: hypothetical protein [Mesorhizobium]
MRLQSIVASWIILLFATCVSHAGSAYLDSAVAAIKSANGQARLDLLKGRYLATSGSSEIIFDVPKDMGSTLKFNYQDRAIVSASWDFERNVLLTLQVGDKCVTISVKRLSYDEGGFVSGDTEQTIVPSGHCRDSEPLARINDFIRLSADPGDLFSGKPFISIKSMRRCVDAKCDKLEQGLPIRRATFYGSSADGRPLSALAASFEEGAQILLPNKGFLSLGPDSTAVFNDLFYDLEAQSGAGLLHKITFGLTDGIISADRTTLRIGPQSRLSADEVDFAKEASHFSISRGSLTGELGRGTSIILSSNGNRDSTLNVTYAKASFSGMNYDVSGGHETLSFARGVLAAQLENAEMWFSEKNSVRLGYTNLDLVLGCPEHQSDSDCRAVRWSDGKVDVYGIINAFSTSLLGGQFNISNVGLVQISSGQIAADTLNLDSSRTITPITGKINKFEVSLQGQDFEIDASTTAHIAQARVRANDLIYKDGQSLPIGAVDVDGSISGFEGGDVGKVRFDAGATLVAHVERADGDEPELTKGDIEGHARARMNSGDFLGADIKIQDIHYYRGRGEASLRLTATDGSYNFDTPSFEDKKSKLGFKADVHVYPIRLSPTLAEPLVLGPTAVKASKADWSIDPIVGVGFKLKVPIAEQELVYAPISPPTGGTLCAPKVILHSQTPNITGKLDVFAANSGGKVRIYDNNLSAGISADADDRGCKMIADTVCFFAGNALLGPIGGAGLAVLCDEKIDKAKEDLANQIRDESVKKVSGSRFDFNY